MRIGVKYCGGCNPFYDRKAEVEKLERNLENACFEPVKQGETYDRILFVCGCQRACIRKLAASGNYSASGYLFAKNREDFAKLQEILTGHAKA